MAERPPARGVMCGRVSSLRFGWCSVTLLRFSNCMSVDMLVTKNHVSCEVQ